MRCLCCCKYLKEREEFFYISCDLYEVLCHSCYFKYFSNKGGKNEVTRGN